MKCAVVAFPDEDKKPHGLGKWLAGYKNNVFEIEVVHMEEPITVCLLPFTEQELREKKKKKQEKVFLRCIRELQSRNVTCVFLTDRVLTLAPVAEFERCFRLPVGKAVFDLMLNDALKWCAKRAHIDLLEAEVGIWQDCFDEHGYRILESICEDLKFATLYTNSDESARVFADKLYMQTGLSLQVSKKLAGLNKCDVVILTQRLEQQIVREEAVILDESGVYPYRCKNMLEFSLPFGFNTLMPYLDCADQRCMEFLLTACGIGLHKATDLPAELKQIGCGLKKVLYKPHKIS